MEKVYVCFNGEYEQRYSCAAFTSKELALQYSNAVEVEVEEVEVWDRLPVKAQAFQASGVFGVSADRRPSSLRWQHENNWHINRQSFKANEYFLKWWSGEKISYWTGQPNGGIFLEVTGASREEVDKRFAALQAEVESGRKPPNDLNHPDGLETLRKSHSEQTT